MDTEACNYDSTANTSNGSCWYAEPYYDCDGVCLNDTDGDGVCDELEVGGCTDDTMLNYDSGATDDDGSCIPFIYGCTNDTMWNYNSEANTDDGSCIPFVYGCTDATKLNYNSKANTDDGS